MKRFNVTVFTLFLLSFNATYSQTTYDVDTSFKVTFDDHSNLYTGLIGDFLVENDGKIMITGTFEHVFQPLLPQKIARLNPDGSIDHTFTYHIVGPFSQEEPCRIAKHKNYYYVGYFSYPGVSRLFNDGTVDTSFHFDYSNYLGSTNFGVADLYVRANDKVMLAGYFQKNGQPGYGLIQLNANGSVDTSFIQTPINYHLTRIRELSDSLYLIGGWVSDLTEQRKGLWRIFGDGTLDTSFNTGASWGVTNWLEVLSNGKIVCTGGYTVPSINDSIHLVRWCQDGKLDTMFTYTRFFEVGAFITHQNKIIASGLFENVNGLIFNQIAAFDTSGQLDTTLFGGNFGPDSTLAFMWPELGHMRLSHDDGILIGGMFNRFNNFSTYCLVKLKRHTVGINEPGKPEEFSLKFSPNPVHENLNIHLNKSIESLAEIYDVHGRLRRSFRINPSQLQYSIPVNDLKNGLYLLRINNLDVSAATKFVVHH